MLPVDNPLHALAQLVELCQAPDYPPDVCGFGATPAIARAQLLAIKRKVPSLSSAVTIVLLVHYPRVKSPLAGGSRRGERAAGTNWSWANNWDGADTGSVFPQGKGPMPRYQPRRAVQRVTDDGATRVARCGAVPARIVRATRARVSVGHALVDAPYDCVDVSAENEGLALERMEELTGYPVPVAPLVTRGRDVDAAIADVYGKGLNPYPAKNTGAFQLQVAQRAAERVARGGAGKLEIVTRLDKSRRVVNRAAKALDVLAGRFALAGAPHVGATLAPFRTWLASAARCEDTAPLLARLLGASGMLNVQPIPVNAPIILAHVARAYATCQ